MQPLPVVASLSSPHCPHRGLPYTAPPPPLLPTPPSRVDPSACCPSSSPLRSLPLGLAERSGGGASCSRDPAAPTAPATGSTGVPDPTMGGVRGMTMRQSPAVKARRALTTSFSPPSLRWHRSGCIMIISTNKKTKTIYSLDQREYI
jgi:hypothetical protein